MRFALALAFALVAGLTGCGGATRGIPKGFRPEAAAAFGTTDIWVVGQRNTLVRSTDGGVHFERVAFPPFPMQGNVPVVEFVSSRIGYAYGPQGDLYVTRDGGASWQGTAA